MQHPGYAHILDIGEAAEYFRRDIDPLHRGTDDAMRRGWLRFHRAGHAQLHRPARHQVAIAHAPRGVGGHHGHAVAGFDRVRLHCQFLSGLPHQRGPRLGRGQADRHGVVGDGAAAGGDELIHRSRRVRPHQSRGGEGHVEFLGHHLQQPGAAAGAQFTAAGIQRGGAVGVDGDPAIHLVRRRTVRADRQMRVGGAGGAVGQRKPDHQRAGALHQGPAVQHGRNA